MKEKTRQDFKRLEKEVKEAERNRHFDKDPKKAALEKTLFDITDAVKKEG